MSFTDYLESALVNLVFRNVAWTPPTTIYLALFTTATTEAGAGTEVVGGSYARQPIAFNAPVTAGLIVSSADEDFNNMPAVTVTHGALMDSLTAGLMLAGGALTAPQTLTAGVTLRFAAGQVQVQLQ